MYRYLEPSETLLGDGLVFCLAGIDGAYTLPKEGTSVFCLRGELPKLEPWDSHSKQVSRQPQKASMLNQLTDLLLECSDCESLHNGHGWLRFALNKCAKCNLGPSLGVRLKTSLDPANAGSRQTSRPAGKQTSRQASQYIYIYTPVLCCTVLCCAVHMGRNEEQDLPSFGLLFR